MPVSSWILFPIGDKEGLRLCGSLSSLQWIASDQGRSAWHVNGRLLTYRLIRIQAQQATATKQA